jgi:EAL domain-containing protein (putative c-di-GMP-specific phosphodiesterase class I)
MMSRGYFVPVAMNVSARNLTDSRLADSIEKIILDKNIQPDLLEIEITESALINHPQRAVENHQKINQLGLPIAIDDFGPAGSNLVRVIELEPSIVKIDPVWFKQMIAKPNIHKLAEKMMNRLNDVGAEVLIQGIETAEEYRWARSCPAAYIQGFLFGAATYLHDKPADTRRLPTDGVAQKTVIEHKVA